MRAAAALVVVFLTATTAAAQPTVPRIQVVPVYATPPAIKISWTEAGGAAYYNVRRVVDGGSEDIVAAIVAVAPGNPVVYVDPQADAAHTYAYRVQVCGYTNDCATSPTLTTSPKVVWPIDGGHEVMHGFNEVIGWAGIGADGVTVGYHMGVDLNKTTGPDVTVGNPVLAPRGGIVNDVQLAISENGAIGIRVDCGDHTEYDTFNHIATTGANAPPVAKGDVVAPGQPIAHIGMYAAFPGNFTKHVHFMQERSPVPAGQQRIIRHPLAVFTDPADRDPHGKAPALFDENKDGKVVLFRDHFTGNLIDYTPPKVVLHGDVDVEPEVLDEQGTNPEQAPIDLGYWIEGPLPDTEQLDDVKSAAHPYRLYDFRVEYFGGIPNTSQPTPCYFVSDILDPANAGCKGQFTCASGPPAGTPCNSAITDTDGVTQWPFPVLHHFVVTHAKGETGAGADVDPNQYWRTAAKDDGQPVGSAHANYAEQPTTTKAWEARFPDGDYTIHAIASDLEHPNVDLPLPVVHLENFAPYVKEIVLAADADGNPATGGPGTPGCEKVVYQYKHPAHVAYPDGATLAAARAAAATTPVRASVPLCVRVRFSEPMGTVSVGLRRQRGAGDVVVGFTGGLTKTYQTGDTFTGTATPPDDPSGAADASPESDENDLAIAMVNTADRPDAQGISRVLDANGDGVPDGDGDLNHLVKGELSRPSKVLTVVKP
jgi:hypothetical protein